MELKEPKKCDKQKTKSKMINLNLIISVTILNVNGLYITIKKQIFADWIKQVPPTCYLQETHIKNKETDRLKVKQSEIYNMQTVTKKSVNSCINIT